MSNLEKYKFEAKGDVVLESFKHYTAADLINSIGPKINFVVLKVSTSEMNFPNKDSERLDIIVDEMTMTVKFRMTGLSSEEKLDLLKSVSFKYSNQKNFQAELLALPEPMDRVESFVNECPILLKRHGLLVKYEQIFTANGINLITILDYKQQDSKFLAELSQLTAEFDAVKDISASLKEHRAALSLFSSKLFDFYKPIVDFEKMKVFKTPKSHNPYLDFDIKRISPIAKFKIVDSKIITLPRHETNDAIVYENIIDPSGISKYVIDVKKMRYFEVPKNYTLYSDFDTKTDDSKFIVSGSDKPDIINYHYKYDKEEFTKEKNGFGGSSNLDTKTDDSKFIVSASENEIDFYIPFKYTLNKLAGTFYPKGDIQKAENYGAFTESFMSSVEKTIRQGEYTIASPRLSPTSQDQHNVKSKIIAHAKDLWSSSVVVTLYDQSKKVGSMLYVSDDVKASDINQALKKMGSTSSSVTMTVIPMPQYLTDNRKTFTSVPGLPSDLKIKDVKILYGLQKNEGVVFDTRDGSVRSFEKPLVPVFSKLDNDSVFHNKFSNPTSIQKGLKFVGDN